MTNENANRPTCTVINSREDDVAAHDCGLPSITGDFGPDMERRYYCKKHANEFGL